MCKLQASWNFVYDTCTSLAGKIGGIVGMRISSPSLASKWAYTTYATCGVVAKLPG